MRVRAGTRLGRYEVVSHLATGGMGEVYRALDTHLGRYVALKTVAERFEHDATSQPRFERERRVSTRLEHPHICRVLDAGREEGIEYFAMELLEGESLARRLERGAIPFEQAVGYAIEIADALGYAHGHGVVHRDLKPANVFLTSTGAKLLDFGLAKVRGGGVQSAGALPDTVPLDLSRPGELIGSTPYMPPERLDGVEADTRSDIFAFGAVVYEMVSGRRAFPGDSAASTIAALTTADPLPLDLPHPKAQDLEWIIRRCLIKSPELRWQAIADVHALLRRMAGSGFGHAPQRQRTAAVVVAAAGVGAVLTALAAWALTDRPSPPAPVALSVVPPVGAMFTPTAGSTTSPQFALSPDSRALAFVASGPDGIAYLWVRHFESLAAIRLNGTEGASFPFWSPDGAALGYFADGMLRRVDVSGGPPRPLAAAPNGRGGSWSEGGTIIFAGGTNSGLQVVSDSGGQASVVTEVDTTRQSGHRWPQFLPDGRHFIFYSRAAVGHDSEEGIYIGSLDGGKPRLVTKSGTGATFVPPDRLLLLADSTLLSHRFDASSGTVSGDPVVIAENVAVSSNFYAAFAASRDGTIAYAPAAMISELQWTRRDGTVERTVGLGRYVDFRLSPDGQALAVAEAGRDSSYADIFRVDLTRGDVRTNRIASSRSTDASPVWSPDGSRVVFRSNRQNAHDLYVAPVTGTGPETSLQTSAFGKYPTSWSKDGKVVFHTHRAGKSVYDILIAEVDRPAISRSLLDGPFNEIQGQVSPDGKWLAYTSDDTGKFQVYVTPLAGGHRVPVSVSGGLDPHWRASGDELFYIDPSVHRLNAVSVARTAQAITIGPPRPLFQVRDAMTGPPYTSIYDVAPDGEHFLVRVAREDVRTTPLAVLFNWPVTRRSQQP